MSKKQRPPMPELPESELRPDDNGTGSAVELAPGDSPYPPSHWPDDSGGAAGGGSRELVYTGDSPGDQFAYAMSLFAAGKPYLLSCPTNIDTTTMRGRALLSNAAQPGDLELEAGKELRLTVRYYAIIPDRFAAREHGEVTTGARTCLITADGRVYRTTSEYGPQRAIALDGVFTPDEWARGIPLVITARPSRRHKGGTWHDIRVDMEALPDAS